jgi:hypothetical protein
MVRKFRRTVERRPAKSTFPCPYSLITTSALASVPQTAGPRRQSLLTTIRFVHEMCSLQPSGLYQRVSDVATDRNVMPPYTPSVPIPFSLNVGASIVSGGPESGGSESRNSLYRFVEETTGDAWFFILSDRDAKQKLASFSTPEGRASRLWSRFGPLANSMEWQCASRAYQAW